jgi:hypothetical protein
MDNIDDRFKGCLRFDSDSDFSKVIDKWEDIFDIDVIKVNKFHDADFF